MLTGLENHKSQPPCWARTKSRYSHWRFSVVSVWTVFILTFNHSANGDLVVDLCSRTEHATNDLATKVMSPESTCSSVVVPISNCRIKCWGRTYLFCDPWSLGLPKASTTRCFRIVGVAQSGVDVDRWGLRERPQDDETTRRLRIQDMIEKHDVVSCAPEYIVLSASAVGRRRVYHIRTIHEDWCWLLWTQMEQRWKGWLIHIHIRIKVGTLGVSVIDVHKVKL